MHNHNAFARGIKSACEGAFTFMRFSWLTTRVCPR